VLLTTFQQSYHLSYVNYAVKCDRISNNITSSIQMLLELKRYTTPRSRSRVNNTIIEDSSISSQIEEIQHPRIPECVRGATKPEKIHYTETWIRAHNNIIEDGSEPLGAERSCKEWAQSIVTKNLG
jgi:hypothetical protein